MSAALYMTSVVCLTADWDITRSAVHQAARDSPVQRDCDQVDTHSGVSVKAFWPSAPWETTESWHSTSDLRNVSFVDVVTCIILWLDFPELPVTCLLISAVWLCETDTKSSAVVNFCCFFWDPVYNSSVFPPLPNVHHRIIMPSAGWGNVYIKKICMTVDVYRVIV